MTRTATSLLRMAQTSQTPNGIFPLAGEVDLHRAPEIRKALAPLLARSSTLADDQLLGHTFPIGGRAFDANVWKRPDGARVLSLVPAPDDVEQTVSPS